MMRFALIGVGGIGMCGITLEGIVVILKDSARGCISQMSATLAVPQDSSKIPFLQSGEGSISQTLIRMQKAQIKRPRTLEIRGNILDGEPLRIFMNGDDPAVISAQTLSAICGRRPVVITHTP